MVLHGEMPSREELWEPLYQYLKCTTYVEWDDSWFYRKLIYALPHKGVSGRWCIARLFGSQRGSDQLQLLARNNSANYSVNTEAPNGANVNHVDMEEQDGRENANGNVTANGNNANGTAVRHPRSATGSNGFFPLVVAGRSNSVSPSDQNGSAVNT